MSRILFAQPVNQHEWLLRSLRRLDAYGHSFTNNGNDADVLLFEARSGNYPFDDASLRQAIARRIPAVIFDYHDDTACGEARKSEWLGWHKQNFTNLAKQFDGQPWGHWLQTMFQNNMVHIYFKKNVQASQAYPPYVYPIDYAWYPEWQQPEDTREQFLARPLDICFIGMCSPVRATAICALIQSGRFRIHWDWYTVRYSWIDWVNKHREAKLFLEADGWSLPNRPVQLAWVAAMLKQNSDYRWAHEWQDGHDCIRFGSYTALPSHDDIERIASYLAEPNKLYDIYRAGRETLKAKFSETALVAYVAKIMRQHGIM